MTEKPTILTQLNEARAERDQFSAELSDAKQMISNLESQLTEANAKAEAHACTIGTLQAQVDQLTEDLNTAAKDVEVAQAACAGLEGELEAVKGKLAMSPEHIQITPGAESFSDDPGTGAPATWAEALKACGGDYAAARRQFPDVFNAFMNPNPKE